MKYIIRFTIIAALVSAFVFCSFAQEKMTKEEWQSQITEMTTKRNDLKNQFAGLQKEVSDLQKQDADKAQALKQCQDDLHRCKASKKLLSLLSSMQLMHV